MTNVYIVKSGQLVDFSGWEWLNLRAFTDYEKAVSVYENGAEPDTNQEPW